MSDNIFILSKKNKPKTLLKAKFTAGSNYKSFSSYALVIMALHRMQLLLAALAAQ